MTQTALLVIDIQNDYFTDGRFPLWNSNNVLQHTETAIRKARETGMEVILVQHQGSAGGPFFTPDSHGVEIHPDLLAIAGDAAIVTKTHADSFLQTRLSALLEQLDIGKLLICGMMSHNCVTHTALSKAAEKYQPAVLADCCTTVSEILHQIALRALTPRIPLLTMASAFPANTLSTAI